VVRRASVAMEPKSRNDTRLPIALVVDDEPRIRMNTADMVAEEGFAVIEARTAREAYSVLEAHNSLQLVVTDIQTGGPMNGCELAWEVNRRWPHICVVVASGAIRPADGELPPSAIFVAKPISPDVVHEAIEEYCGQCDVR
jgi:DNA-binding NtrC family response regulator